MDRTQRNLIHIERIDHVVLRTANVAALKKFYCNVLGCVVERELAPDVGLIQLRAGEALIDLVDVDSELGRMGGSAPGGQGNNLDHFCLQISPLSTDELLAELASHGIDAGPFSRRYGATGFAPSVYLRDPDGNSVELRIVGTEEPR